MKVGAASSIHDAPAGDDPEAHVVPLQPTPRTIGPYTLLEQIGRGGMGEVYRALAPSGAKVAIKVLKPELTGHPEVRRRFTREARAAARLEHPHIVRLVDFGSERGEYYLVMELVTGGSLAAWRVDPPDGGTLVEVFHQLLRALGYAHSRGVVHRDLKPENVLLSFDDEGHPCAKIMDFGVVFFRDERDFDVSGIQAVVGTPAYMAPEQGLSLCDACPATDLYSFGVMIFEFLCGRRPYHGESTAGTVVAHVKEPIPPLEPRPGFEIDGDLEGFVRRLLAKDPAHRFLFAADARRALDRVRIRGAAAGSRSVAAPADAQAPLDETLLRTVIRPIAGIVGAEPEPSSAYRLFGLREPPFEGRDELLAELRASVVDALDSGRGGVTLLAGEMGLGKSRILRHLRESLEEPGRVQVWAGSYDGRPEGPEVGYRQALRRGLGVAGLSPAELRVRVAQILARQQVDDAWELEAVCELLLPDQGVRELLLADERAEFAAVDRVLRRAGRDRPVLLVLDDLHLGDGDALRMLSWLLHNPDRSGAWYALGTYRSEFVGGDTAFARALEAFRSAPHPWVDEVALSRLGGRELEAILASCVPLDRGLAAAMATRAEGNPLVAVELLRHVVDSGKLEGFGVAPAPEEVLVGVPSAVATLVERRVDEASAPDPSAAAVWERLAFVGLRFGAELGRAAVVGRVVETDAAFDAAVELGLLHGVLHATEEDGLRFDSGLMRDALLERARRRGDWRRVHGEVGEAKAARFGAPLSRGARRAATRGDNAIEVARHFDLAGRADDAAPWYRAAAEHAEAHDRMERAVEAWDGLLALAPGLGGPALAVEASIGAARARLKLARLEGARGLAMQAEALAVSASLSPPVQARLVLADVARLEGDLREARHLYGHAAGIAETPEERARAWLGLGLLELRDGRLPEAERHTLAAREAFRSIGDDAAAAEASLQLARTALATGLADEALGVAREARAEFARLERRRGVASSDLALGDIALERGDAAGSRAAYEAALAPLSALGDWHAATAARLGIGRAAALADEHEAARAAFDEAARAYRGIGDDHGAAVAELFRALLDAGAGRWSAAEPTIAGVLERDAAERIDAPEFIGGLIDLARAALFGGRADLARTLLETAAYKLDRTGASSTLYDRVDEVHYLLGELDAGTDLDEPAAVVDLFDED